MGGEFRLKESERAELRDLLEREVGFLDHFADADDLHRLLDSLRGAGVLECPEALEIVVYPSAGDERDVALISVLSCADPNAHVVAASEAIGKLATGAIREGADPAELTLEIVEGAIGLANDAVPAVRELEGREERRAVRAAARCPRCGADDQLRFEYRYDVLGISAAGGPVLTEDGELTDIFCLSCCEEVDDVLGPEGPILARERSDATQVARSRDAGGGSPLEAAP